MRQINVLLSVLISLALAVSVMEFGLRFAGFGFPETLNQYDADTGWSKTPGKVVESSTRDFDVTLEINELGLRDDPMSSPAKTEDNVFRVLCLGDSFTLGYTVEQEEAFADLCEQWWQAEGRRVEVINAGIPHFDTDHLVAALTKCRHDLGAVIVDSAVDQYRARQRQRLEQLEQPPNANPVAIFAPGEVQHIGRWPTRGQLSAKAFAKRKVLQIQGHVERETVAGGPCERGSAGDGLVVEAIVRGQLHGMISPPLGCSIWPQ